MGVSALDVAEVVEVTKHVDEETSVEGEQEVDALRVVAITEHDAKVVVENDAELYLKE